MMLNKPVHILIALLLCAGCTAESVGIDSDGDGLSDSQELRFCTNPRNPDTDGDTIPDAIDTNPCELPGIVITPKVVRVVSGEHKAEATIQIGVQNTKNLWVGDVPIQLTATAGQLSDPFEQGTGLYEVQLTSDADIVSVISIYTIDENGQPDNRASESIRVELKLKNSQTDPPDPPDPPNPQNPVLEIPGLNPGRYQTAGPMNGELTVMAIDGQTLDWSESSIAPYKSAYVQIDFADGESIHGWTDETGFVHFADERLKSPVNITVGAPGARYITWMHADARYVSAGIHSRDITAAEADLKGSEITGTVRGFWGETGIPSFPRENSNVFKTINIAIVQVATRNYPLSSMNTGAILLPPDGSSQTAAYFDIPPNLVIANYSHPELSRFRLNQLIPGKYVVFALAGAGGNILAASQNPYELEFVPMALGMKEIEVKAGDKTDITLDLTVDLRNAQVASNDLYFGHLPPDPQTGEPLPMGLVLPLINTGKGYIFTDINATYNHDGFKNPVTVMYPQAVHQTLAALGLEAHPMVVGLAGRKAVNGFDRPGISTLIMHPQSQGGTLESVYMNNASQWPALPQFITPKPPESQAFDAVGASLNPSRVVSWDVPDDADMTVLRFNYMTPPIHNELLNSDIGASQSHPLWEVYVPAPYHQIVLPTLDTSAPDYPVLVNYAPTVPGDAYQYDAHTVELEINAYYMGPRSFNYQADFRIDDVNMNAWAVSQDSYLIDVR